MNYRNHGLVSRDNVEDFGVNSRLDVIHAEILKFRLKKLKWVIERRSRNIEIYKKYINNSLINIPVSSNLDKNISSNVMFLVGSEKRDALKQYLFDNGIETLIYYGKPLHLHLASKKLGYQKGDFPVAENLANRVLALPHHQYLTKKQIVYVCEIINKFK